MEPSITIAISREGELEIQLNSQGRDLLIKELKSLGDRSDYFHLGPKELGSEVPLQSTAYHDGDRVIDWGKVFFRTDARDARHFSQLSAVSSKVGI